MGFETLLCDDCVSGRVALLEYSGPLSLSMLSPSWRWEALAAATSLRVLARTPLEAILAAVRRHRNLCYLDLGGCCSLDGDGAMAQVLDVLRAAGRRQLRGLHLAGTPLGRRTAQGLARLGISGWAFPAKAVERGCVLLGHAGLASTAAQPHLDKAVVLVTEHHPERGTEGLVLNQPMSMQVRGLSAGAGAFASAPGRWSPTFDACAVHFAGDASENMCVLHGHRNIGGLDISPGLFLVRDSEEQIRQARIGVERGKYARDSFQFLFGSCHWGPGCLQQELQANLWHLAHCDSCFVVHGSSAPESLWSDLKILVT